MGDLDHHDDSDSIPLQVRELTQMLRERRVGRWTLLERLMAKGPQVMRNLDYLYDFDPKRLTADVPTLDTSAEPEPKIVRRKRRPDFLAMVKRAQAAGLNVSAVTRTADGVSLTLNNEAPASSDATVIETADDLRKLI